MIGTIVYMFLDVSFNVLLWSSQKAIEGTTILGNQIIKKYQDINKPQLLMIENKVKPMNVENTQEYYKEMNEETLEPPSYNNTLQSISIEDIKIIKKQIECQTKMLNELEIILENQKKKC